MDRVFEALHAGDRSEWEHLEAADRDMLADLLRDLRDGGRPMEHLALLWEIDYKERPRTIEEFLTEPRLFGEIGKDIYPRWWDELRTVFDPQRRIWQWLATGSIGSGKSFTAVAALCYGALYRLSILRDPQRFYGLAPNSLMVVGLYNVHKYKVEGTSFAEMLGMMSRSPYFSEQFRYDPKKSKWEIDFPNRTKVITGSTELHALGNNLFASMIDEANFMANETGGRTQELERARGQAHRLHASVLMRMKSRFLEEGSARVPGLLLLVSSAKDHEDYMEKEIGIVLADPDMKAVTHVTTMSMWEAKPWKYGTDFFRVLVGDGQRASRILKPGESDAGGKVIPVPAAHAADFRRDIEGAIRDIAGVPTFGVNLFLPWPEKINAIAAVLPNRVGHPFTVTTAESDALADRPIDALLDRRLVAEIVGGALRPKVSPEAPRFIHIDLSVSKDRTGFAMGHVIGVREVVRTSLDDGRSYVEQMPVLYIDLVLQIRAAQGSQVDYSKLRGLVVALRSCGYAIEGVSFDSFQSVDSIQILTRMGFLAELLSIDRVDGVSAVQGAPYDFLKAAIWEGRFSCYQYEPLFDELRTLRRIPVGKDRFGNVVYKVDHPPSKSKDTSDSVAGVCWHLMTKTAAQYTAIGAGVAREGIADLDQLTRARAEPESDVNWLLKDHKDARRITGLR